ncbi:hypothetical protein [Nocardia asteroides]|uniref:hypothetical protein n=1 Tax=Nocardia asteroides TaxID=1824 RepID=UPI001E3B01C5|nr:hypothetical protein [Nocardia asteroides]UGT55301.1 hypothetical protein LTT85_00015 [Nocardia asteroides]
MTTMTWRVLGASTLIAGAALVSTIAAGSAQAEPQGCTLDRRWDGASAHCGGDGTYILEVDCFGVSVSGGQPFGPYYKSVTGHTDPTMDPIFTHPQRNCMNPLTLGQIGIATDARITLVPTRPAPSNAYE